jgi:hypothetical protein
MGRTGGKHGLRPGKSTPVFSLGKRGNQWGIPLIPFCKIDFQKKINAVGKI